MRKLLIALAMVVALIALAAPAALAAGVNIVPDCGAGAAGKKTPVVCQDISTGQGDTAATNPIISIIKGAIDVISYVVGAAAVINLIVSGLRLITSGGDTGSQASARSGVIYSIIGIAIAAGAQIIVIFVLSNVK